MDHCRVDRNLYRHFIPSTLVEFPPLPRTAPSIRSTWPEVTHLLLTIDLDDLSERLEDRRLAGRALEKGQGLNIVAAFVQS